MADEVFMDIPAVREMSSSFDTIGDVLQGVAKALEILANILKATAFIGMVGGFAVLMIIEQVRPYIEEIAEKCLELAKDLTASIDAYERGDTLGATRFH